MSHAADIDIRDGLRAKRRDAIAGVVVLALAAFILVGSLRISNSSYSNSVLSPRDFPLLIGILMAIAGAAMVLRNVNALRPGQVPPVADQETAVPEQAPDATDAEDPPDTVTAQNPRTLGLLLALLLGYILVFATLGYLLSTFLFLAVGTMMLASKHPIRNVAFAAVFATAVYLLFTAALNVRLPAGLLEGMF